MPQRLRDSEVWIGVLSQLFQIITGCRRKAKDGHADADVIMQEPAILLSFEQPERPFETIVAWGRDAERIDYDQGTRTVFRQERAAVVSVAATPASGN